MRDIPGPDLGKPPVINPPVWLMAVTAFTVGCGMRLLDPLLPMLAREFGTGLGAVAPLIGGFALAYGVGQLATGPLGDRLGKMRVIVVSMTLYALTLFGAGMASGLPMLLGFRIAAGFAAAAMMPLFMAYIGDRVPYQQRQAVIGQLLMGMVAAQMLAGPLSGTIAQFLGWRWCFLALGLAATAATLLFALRLGPALWQKGKDEGRGIGLSGFLRILQKPSGRRLLGAGFLDGLLLFGGAFPFIASLVIERFHLETAQAGLVVACFGAGSLVYTTTAGRLLAAFGERRLVLWGGIGLTVALTIFALSTAWWQVALTQCVVGLLFFMLHGVLQARSTEALPEARGTAVAAFAMALFFGQSLGALLFGTLIVAWGYAATFLLAAAATLALAIWVRTAIIQPA